MRAFVTGGTGFLGTYLVQLLDREGWDIIALHRPNSDLRALAGCTRVRTVAGDITDIASLRRALPESTEAAFHVAGSAEQLPHSEEPKRYRINHEGTRNVLQVCQEKRIGRLVHTSTIATYDYRAPQPLTEDSPANDWSRDAYIHSKRLAEIEIDKARAGGLDAIVLHPCAIFGAYDKSSWSKLFLEIERGLPLPVAPPGGIDTCHAAGVAAAHLAAFHRAPRNRHYILGGPAVSYLELAQAVARILCRPGPRVTLPAPLFKLFGYAEFAVSALLRRTPVFTPHTITLMSEKFHANSGRAIAELGYCASSLDEMLIDCYCWMVRAGMLSARTSGMATAPVTTPKYPACAGVLLATQPTPPQ